MERGYVRGFDAVAKAELWERWRRGESPKAIGRAFGKPSSSIYFQVAPHGGDKTCAEAAFPAGIDAFGARGDFARHCGGPIDALDSQVAGSRAVDGKSGDQAQWRL
jgi:hypothetical protein